MMDIKLQSPVKICRSLVHLFNNIFILVRMYLFEFASMSILLDFIAKKQVYVHG